MSLLPGPVGGARLLLPRQRSRRVPYIAEQLPEIKHRKIPGATHEGEPRRGEKVGEDALKAEPA